MAKLGVCGVQDVVGVSPDVQGARLGVRLLRSVLTLGAIHLMRFGFAIGTAQVVKTLQMHMRTFVCSS